MAESNVFWNWGNQQKYHALIETELDKKLETIPDVCTVITDWNTATANGWYVSNSASNAPTETGWYYGITIVYNNKYLRQIVYKFAGVRDIAKADRYERISDNENWGSWTNTSVKTAVPENAVFTDTVYTHPTSGVTAGTYQTVTVDENGHITAGSNAITQTNSEVNSDFRVLLSGGANDTTQGTIINKSKNFTANPSTGAFYAKGYNRNNITGQELDLDTLTFSTGSPEMAYYFVTFSGGASKITNIPVAGQAFMLRVELVRWASATDYITKQTFVSGGNLNAEFVRFCHSGTWSAWVNRSFSDAGLLAKSGGTMTGALVAQSNTAYTTAQVRNVTMSTEAATGGSNGQIHYQYE